MRRAVMLATVLAPELVWGGTLPAIVPSAGAELLTNPGLEAPYTAGVANGWSTFGALTPTQETTIIHGGASSQKIVTGGASQFLLQTYATPVLGEWYYATCWLYATAGSTQLNTNNSARWQSGASAVVNSAAWTQVFATGRVISAAATGPIMGNMGAATFYVDDASFVQMTLASLLSTRLMQQVNGIFTNRPTRVTGTQVGVVHYANATNQVVAYLDGVSNIRLVKNVAGTWTNIQTTAVTYVADAALTLQRSGAPGAGLYTITYNGAAVGTPQSITDAVFDTARQWGNFSTYSGNTFGGQTWTGPH